MIMIHMFSQMEKRCVWRKCVSVLGSVIWPALLCSPSEPMENLNVPLHPPPSPPPPHYLHSIHHTSLPSEVAAPVRLFVCRNVGAFVRLCLFGLLSPDACCVCLCVGGCVWACLVLKPYGLSVSMQAARTGSSDAGKKHRDETWGAYCCLLPLPFSCLLLSTQVPLFSHSPHLCCLYQLLIFLRVAICPSWSQLVFPFLLLLITSCILAPTPFLNFCTVYPSVLRFLSKDPFALFWSPHWSALLFFASSSLFSNKIRWCDMIHFHVFLRSLESWVLPDLNLHVGERI